MRLFMGERFQRATPGELRWYAGVFTVIPVWLILFMRVGHLYLDQAESFGLWLFIMGFVLSGFLWLTIWGKYVAATISWWLGGVVWLVALWLAINSSRLG
jgi:hypothetical protein